MLRVLHVVPALWIAGCSLGLQRSTNPELQTQLADAIRAGQIERVRKLLRKGADPNREPWRIGSALNLAVGLSEGRLEMVRLLLEAGAGVTQESVLAACRTEDPALLRVIIESPQARKHRGEILRDVAEHGTPGMLAMVLNLGVPLNERGRGGNALERLVGDGVPDPGDIEKARMLIERGIKIDGGGRGGGVLAVTKEKSRTDRRACPLHDVVWQAAHPKRERDSRGFVEVQNPVGVVVRKTPSSVATALTRFRFLHIAELDGQRVEPGGRWLRVAAGQRFGWVPAHEVRSGTCGADFSGVVSSRRPISYAISKRPEFRLGQVPDAFLGRHCPPSEIFARIAGYELCLATVTHQEGAHKRRQDHLLLRHTRSRRTAMGPDMEQHELQSDWKLPRSGLPANRMLRVAWKSEYNRGATRLLFLHPDTVVEAKDFLNQGEARCDSDRSQVRGQFYYGLPQAENRVSPDGKTLFRLELFPRCFPKRRGVVFGFSRFDVVSLESQIFRGKRYVNLGVPDEHLGAWAAARPFGYRLPRPPTQWPKTGPK